MKGAPYAQPTNLFIVSEQLNSPKGTLCELMQYNRVTSLWGCIQNKRRVPNFKDIRNMSP